MPITEREDLPDVSRRRRRGRTARRRLSRQLRRGLDLQAPLRRVRREGSRPPEPAGQPSPVNWERLGARPRTSRTTQPPSVPLPDTTRPPPQLSQTCNPWLALYELTDRVPVISSHASHPLYGPAISPSVFPAISRNEFIALRNADPTLQSYRPGLPILQDISEVTAFDPQQREVYEFAGYSYAYIIPQYPHETIYRITASSGPPPCPRSGCLSEVGTHRRHLLEQYPPWPEYEPNTIQYSPPAAQLASLAMRRRLGLSPTSDYSYLDDNGVMIQDYILRCLHGDSPGDDTLSLCAEAYYWRTGRTIITDFEAVVTVSLSGRSPLEDLFIEPFSFLQNDDVSQDERPPVYTNLDEYLIPYAASLTPRLRLNHGTTLDVLIHHYEYLYRESPFPWPLWLIARLHEIFTNHTHLRQFSSPSELEDYPIMHHMWIIHRRVFPTSAAIFTSNQYMPYSITLPPSQVRPHPAFTSRDRSYDDSNIAIYLHVLFLTPFCVFCANAPSGHNRQPHTIHRCRRWWRQQDYRLRLQFREHTPEGHVNLRAKDQKSVWRACIKLFDDHRIHSAYEEEKRRALCNQHVLDALYDFYFQSSVILPFQVFYEHVIFDPTYLERHFGIPLDSLVQSFLEDHPDLDPFLRDDYFRDD